MKRYSATALLLAVGLLALVAPARLLAHDGDEHKIMGTVTMAASDHLMLKNTDGKSLTIQVTKDTTVKAPRPMKVEEIKPGTRVVVTAVTVKETITAKVVEVGVATPPPSR